MLFKRRFLDGIVGGTITLAFRRWRRPSVRSGGRLRTAVGVLAIDAVDRVEVDRITEQDARRAGYRSRTALVDELNARGEGDVYRIAVRFAGPDPREELRRRDALTPDELTDLRRRLARMDSASPRGPWTRVVLELIADRPGTRAADLAAALGREKRPFKADVRKLKELGLTESLDVGYRLSRRGQVLLTSLGRSRVEPVPSGTAEPDGPP